MASEFKFLITMIYISEIDLSYRLLVIQAILLSFCLIPKIIMIITTITLQSLLLYL